MTSCRRLGTPRAAGHPRAGASRAIARGGTRGPGPRVATLVPVTEPPAPSGPRRSAPPAASAPPPATPLSDAVAATERHVAEGGWDQPTRLYALVPDADLREREPELARRLGVTGTGYTAVEQDDFVVGPGGLEEALGQVMWPPEVAGTAVVHEVLVLPPGAEAEAPADADDDALAAWVARRPDRRDVRLAVGVLRDGADAAVLRVRPVAQGGTAPPPADVTGDEAGDEVATDELLTGPDLAPGLAAALRATLA